MSRVWRPTGNSTESDLTCSRAARLTLFSALLGAASASPAAIYSCVDSNGRRLTSDRPIPECSAREQRMLNADGSVSRIVPPTMTADELVEHEAKKRQEAAERVARQDAIRRDRNLINRFPNESAHDKAREAALDDVRKGVKFSEDRLEELEKARKPLQDETEFYAGKKLPAQLKQKLDANEALASAQRSLIQNQKDEILRINKLYDVELARLRKLWSGAAAGSLPDDAPPPTGTTASGK
jgi:Domain of unknown function (DUF4124)